MNIKDQPSTTWLSVFLLSFLIVLSLVPIIQRTLGGYFIMLPLVLVFLATSCMGNLRISISNFPFFVCALSFILLSYVYMAIGISTAGYGRNMHEILYFTFFLSIEVIKRADQKKKRFLLIVLMGSVLYTIGYNFFLFRRLGAFHYFRLHHINTTGEQLGNLANTQFSTAIMLMSGILLMGIIHDKKKKRRIAWIVIFIICVWFNIAIAQRTINLILSAAMFVLIIVFNKRNRLVVDFLLILGLIIFSVVLIDFDRIVAFLTPRISSSRISMRLNQINTYLNSGDIEEAGGSLSARYNLFATSINTWLRSPASFFFGAGDHTDDNSIIGNHSQFLDVFGKYGILGASLFLYSVFKSIQMLIIKLQLPTKSNILKQTQTVCLFFWIRGFLGGVVYEQIGACMLVLFPIVISMIREYNPADLSTG